MMMFPYKYFSKKNFCFKIAVTIFGAIFSLTGVMPMGLSQAQNITQPIPIAVTGSIVASSPNHVPVMLRGLNVVPNNPFRFDFIIDKGEPNLQEEVFRNEAKKLTKYFLAALTVPDEELWVNLSPYEENRIIPEPFGKTEMGTDLLAQDYLLKQLTASLLHPEGDIGKRFWEKLYAATRIKSGSTDIPMETFNKIWIIPQDALVYEHEKGAFIVHSKLKVLLEQDYLAMRMNQKVTQNDSSNLEPLPQQSTTDASTEALKELLIPAIEEEVNNGELFVNLRQIYAAVILANWYKQSLRKTILGKIYVDQHKTGGLESEAENATQKIYQQYITAFAKGAFQLIREDYDPTTNQFVPRKYFSGGANLNLRVTVADPSILGADFDFDRLTVAPQQVTVDLAMASDADSDVEGDPDGNRTHAVVERDLKGSSASVASSRWTDELLRAGRLGEYVIEDGVLKLRVISFRGVYRPGKTSPAEYLVDEEIKKISIKDQESVHYLTSQQRNRIERWLKKHTNTDNPTITQTPRIRVILGDVSIHFKQNLGNSHILYADNTDNAIYIGERLLQLLFDDGQDELREMILEKYLFNDKAPSIASEAVLTGLESVLQKLYLDDSERLIKRASVEQDTPIAADTKIMFHVMPHNKMGVSKTFASNTESLRAMQTREGQPVDAVMFPVAADETSMHDAQRILAYIRFNPRLLGMIPAAGFKDTVGEYLDQTSAISQYLGVDPVFKDANGQLQGDLDLGRSVRLWFEASRGPVSGKKFLILGAGVTGMATAYELIQSGAESVVISDVFVHNLNRAHKIKKQLLDQTKQGKIQILHGRNGSEAINQAVGEVDVVFNATGLGKEPDVEKAPTIEYAKVHNGQLWIDFNYHPKLTMFLQKILKYGARTSAEIDNAIDLTAFINASHLELFLRWSSYGKTSSREGEQVTLAEIYRKTIESWRQKLSASILEAHDRVLRYNHRTGIPRWQTDGILAEDLNTARNWGFTAVRHGIVESGQKIPAYSITYASGYTPPHLKVKSLRLVRGVETPIGIMGADIIRGGEPSHVEDLTGLTGRGIAEARVGAKALVDIFGQELETEVVFLSSSAPSTVATAKEQLANMAEIMRNTHPDFAFEVNSRLLVPGAVDIRDRMAGTWGGVSLDSLKGHRGGIREFEIAIAAMKGSDVFGRAETPGQEGIQPENTLMVIKRALEFINYLNTEHEGKDVVVYLNGFMINVLQAILAPQLFNDEEFIIFGGNNPFITVRGMPYDIRNAVKESTIDTYFNSLGHATDAAMSGESFTNTAPGGIDLNPTMLTMAIENSTNDIAIPTYDDPSQLINLNQNPQKLVPIIINIRPIPSVSLFFSENSRIDGNGLTSLENGSSPATDRPDQVSEAKTAGET